MSSKLLKELERKENRSKRNIANNAILNDNKVLLLDAHSEEQKILETLGLDHELQTSRALENEQTRTRLAEEKYNKSIYSGEQVMHLCHKYDLRILPAKRYNGTIPPALATAIKDFCDEQGLTIRQNSFYILAPSELFKKEVHKAYADPILFYKEGSAEESSSHNACVYEEDKLITVHNWGNDFSLVRKYRWLWSSWRYNSSDHSNFRRLLYASGAVLLAILIQVFISVEIFFGVIIIPLLIILTTILGSSYFYKKNKINHRWNKEYQY